MTTANTEKRMETIQSGVKKLPIIGGNKVELDVDAELKQFELEQMAALGLEPVFPVWGRDTTELARDFFHLGFQAVLVCVDTDVLDPVFAGRSFDEDLLRDLPADVDPCGENGEFHTFVHAGPIFRRPVEFKLGRVEGRGRFWFRDLEAEGRAAES